MQKAQIARFVGLLTLVLAMGCKTSATATPATQSPASSPAKPSVLLPLPSPSLVRLSQSGKSSATIADVVERVLPSVVSISSTRVRRTGPNLPDDPFFRFFFGPQGPHQREHKEQGLGSGVVVGKDIVVTNNHVVENATEIKVTTYDNHELEAELVGTDPKSDLAVLRLKGNTEVLSPIAMGDSSRLRLGDVVLAVGNPFGVGQTVTMGIVSAKGRADLGIVDYEDFIQTDAAINPGNSGGALVDMEGNLVGINTAILSRTGGNMGIGFAIPTAMARPIVDSLLSQGKVVRGWLGVSIQSLDPDLAKALGIRAEAGVLINGVQKASPAERAGVLQGDLVTAVDGKPVGSPGELRNLIASAGADRKVRLTIERKGETISLEVPLGAMPDNEATATPDNPKNEKAKPSDFGMALEPLNQQLRSRLEVPESVVAGVVVTNLDPSSEAAKSGVRPGDVFLEVAKRKVKTPSDVVSAWRETTGPIPVLLFRRGMTSYLVVKREPKD